MDARVLNQSRQAYARSQMDPARPNKFPKNESQRFLSVTMDTSTIIRGRQMIDEELSRRIGEAIKSIADNQDFAFRPADHRHGGDNSEAIAMPISKQSRDLYRDPHKKRTYEGHK